MFGKKFIKLLVIVIVFIAIAGFADKTYAAGSAGAACFRDDLGGFWTIDYFDYATGSGNFGISGNRLAAVEICNNSRVQPVVGSANFLPNGITMIGMQTIINDPGKCTGVSWAVPANRNSQVGIGGWRDQNGAEGPFTLWVVDCASGLPLSPPITNVSIGDNSFSPQTVTINVGDTVKWTNNGVALHNSISTGTFPWNSGNLSSGQTFSLTFTQPGTFVYTCTIHGFSGTVVVN